MTDSKNKLPKEFAEFMLDCLEYDHYENIVRKEDADERWIVHEANLPTLKLDIEVPHEEIAKEVLAFAETHGWHKHNGERHPGWYGLTIHGQEYWMPGTPDNYPNYEFTGWHWTTMADECPKTVEWLKSLPWNDWQRIRFMLLEPGGWVCPHVDMPPEENRLGPINISITNPEECHFFMEKAGEIPWKPGEVRMMNVSKMHAVYNNSDQPRIHAIIHAAGDKDKTLGDMIVKAYQKILDEA